MKRSLREPEAGPVTARRRAVIRIPGFGLSLFVLVAALLAGCPDKPKPDAVKDAGVVTPVATTDDGPGDPVHGKELVLTYQCNRCHDGTGHPAATQSNHCVHCHKDIMEGRFKASTEAAAAKWKARVKDLTEAPSLEAVSKRFSKKWIERYLLEPHDMRPHLSQTMPRLAITPAEARDVAAYLTEGQQEPAANTAAVANADLGKGRQLLDTKGCGSCHAMSLVLPIANSPPPAMDAKDFDRGHKIAPDLRFTRDRWSAARLVAWLKDPKSIKPDTQMPRIALSDSDIRDLAGYILTVDLPPSAPMPKPARLPVLARKVTFKEVDEKVFHRTCWHCHSEPDYSAIGDGGPGNTGGFGFKPRKMILSDYAGIAAGFVDDKGERSSVFMKDADGTPYLVKTLLVRHDEVAGMPGGPVRGMPLGYEPLAMEDIQLVETWIAQGRPR